MHDAVSVPSLSPFQSEVGAPRPKDLITEPVRLVIMGKMAAGKTQAATFLAEQYGATTWTIAQRIKETAHALVDQTGQLDMLLESVIVDPALRAQSAVALLRFADGYELEPGKPRKLYQEVGQILRDLHPSTSFCWEEELERRIQRSGQGLTVVDLRSKEGYRFFVVDRGYRTLRIDATEEVRRRRLLARDRFAVVDDAVFTHQSETEVDSLEFEFVIDNNRDDLELLHDRLEAVVAAIRPA
jgi:dephospho-CoA kinase